MQGAGCRVQDAGCTKSISHLRAVDPEPCIRVGGWVDGPCILHPVSRSKIHMTVTPPYLRGNP